MNKENEYTKINSEMWNDWASSGGEWSLSISHEDYVKATEGIFEMYLTPCQPVPKEWFIPLEGAGLASGGGQQCPIFAAQKADITVFDYSDNQLELDKEVTKREEYTINIIKGDMANQLPFEDETFDMIFHPVSNCFVQDVEHVWRECYRILKKVVFYYPVLQTLHSIYLVREWMN